MTQDTYEIDFGAGHIVRGLSSIELISEIIEITKRSNINDIYIITKTGEI